MSLHIVQIIDNLIIGGAQKLLVTLASQAEANRLELTIVSLSLNNDRVILDELASLGTKVIIFPAQHLLDLRCIFRLSRFLSGKNFDLVQCHLTYANIIGTLCGRLASLPVVTTLHSTEDVLQEFHTFIGVLETWTIRHLAKRVVAVGYSIADSFQERLRGRAIDVIPNAVPIPARITEKERLELRKEITGDMGKKIVISVGRIALPKGYEDLVTAFSFLVPSHPNLVLILIGDGPLFEEIRNLISRLSLEKNVLLLGAREDVPRLLAASDLYVSSSHWEGLPLAILEAMMAGLPIVATRVGDIPSVVTADIGLVVPPHQPESIAEAIAKLLDEPANLRQMGAAGRALAVEQYSPQAWMERLSNFYAQTLR